MVEAMNIKIRRGLDLPLSACPSGEIKELPIGEKVALDLTPFETFRFTLLKKEGEGVLLGEPLVEDKGCAGRVFASPASGKILEVVRGEKRRLLRIIVESDDKQTPYRGEKGSIETLMEGGLFPHLRVRPCERIAEPGKKPEAIFVKAISSSPYAPPPELEVKGFEEFFLEGLKALQSLATVHLICHETSRCSPFIEAPVNVHGASGPHPIENPSVHIAALNPVLRRDQVIWSVGVNEVIAVGLWVRKGEYHSTKVISVAGEGVSQEARGFYRVNRGMAVAPFYQGSCFLSGTPLDGVEVGQEDFLGFYHHALCAFSKDEEKRAFLPFMKLQKKGFSAFKGYFSSQKNPTFTTAQHGEERAFVDGGVYDRVMPLPIETMPLIKACLAEDWEKAEALGLLEVSPEDFALSTFICPSKIEMVEIIRKGLRAYASQYFS